MKKMILGLSFLVMPMVLAAQLHPLVPNAPYKFHYAVEDLSGYMEATDALGNTNRFELAEIQVWTQYAKPPKNRFEDRLVIEAGFSGTNMSIRALLEWDLVP